MWYFDHPKTSPVTIISDMSGRGQLIVRDRNLKCEGSSCSCCSFSLLIFLFLLFLFLLLLLCLLINLPFPPSTPIHKHSPSINPKTNPPPSPELRFLLGGGPDALVVVWDRHSPRLVDPEGWLRGQTHNLRQGLGGGGGENEGNFDEYWRKGTNHEPNNLELQTKNNNTR